MGAQRKSEGSQKTRVDDLSEEQFEAAVTNVTVFLLCEIRLKKKIRKDDVVANALNKSAKQYAAIMKRVKENLLNVFGLLVAKVENSEDAFIIVNKHRTRFAELTWEFSSEEEIQNDLILTIVLGSIFMNRGHMYEDHVLVILETIGFMSEKFYGSSCMRKVKDHVIKLVTNVFVKQMYLESESVNKPDQPQQPPLPETGKNKVNVLSWGFRAYLEVDVDKVVDYLIKIHDGKKPAAFPAGHCKELKAKQNQIRAQYELT